MSKSGLVIVIIREAQNTLEKDVKFIAVISNIHIGNKSIIEKGANIYFIYMGKYILFPYLNLYF